jgi:hypothetical protein
MVLMQEVYEVRCSGAYRSCLYQHMFYRAVVPSRRLSTLHSAASQILHTASDTVWVLQPRPPAHPHSSFVYFIPGLSVLTTISVGFPKLGLCSLYLCIIQFELTETEVFRDRLYTDLMTLTLFLWWVGLRPSLGPFFRSPRFRFLRSLCSSPLSPCKSQHCGHTLAYCAFPGWYMRVIVE